MNQSSTKCHYEYTVKLPCVVDSNENKFDDKMPATIPHVKLSLVNSLSHACTPSAQVCSKFMSPSSPQVLNQAPPRAQQLRLPDFLIVPQLSHPLLFILTADELVIVGASVGECERWCRTKGRNIETSYSHRCEQYMWQQRKQIR